MKTNKKAQFSVLNGIGFGLVTFAVMIAIGIVILTGFGNTTATCSGDVLTSVIVANETGWINATPYTFIYSTQKGFTNLAIIYAKNVSGGMTGLGIDSANWTLSATSIRNATTNILGYNFVNLTYSYDWTNTHTWNLTSQSCLNDSLGDEVSTSSAAWVNVNYLNTQLGTQGLTGWTPAIIAVMVGMLLLGFFAMGKGKKTNY